MGSLHYIPHCNDGPPACSQLAFYPGTDRRSSAAAITMKLNYTSIKPTAAAQTVPNCHPPSFRRQTGIFSYHINIANLYSNMSSFRGVRDSRGIHQSIVMYSELLDT